MKKTGYEENPFKVMCTLKAAHRAAKKSIFSLDTGELTHGIVEHKQHWIDEEKFVKFYGSGLKVMSDLSSASLKLLSYVLSILPPKKDTIAIDIDHAITFCRFNSYDTYRRAINGLLEANVLAQKTSFDRAYFINPNFYFNGDRRNFMKLEHEVSPGLVKAGNVLPLTDRRAC